MIETKGNFSNGREKMKTKRAEALKEIRKIEKKHNLTTEESYRLEFYKKSVPVYSLSQNLPARYGGIVINSKLLIAFMKKLKGLDFVALPKEDKLIVSYENENMAKGKLELYDQSKYFEEFNDIPSLVWSDSE